MSDFIASAFISDLIQAPDKEAAKTLLEVGSGGATSLNDLTDVDTATSSPQQNQVLQYDAGTWFPKYLLLGSCADVSGTYAASEGQALVYRLGSWQPYAIQDLGLNNLSSLSDVNLNVNGSPQGGQILYYDSNVFAWVNRNLELDDLSNVTAENPSNGQILKYSNGAWAAADESVGAPTGVSRPSDFFSGAMIDGIAFPFPKYENALTTYLMTSDATNVLYCNLNWFNDSGPSGTIFLPAVSNPDSLGEARVYDCFGVYQLLASGSATSISNITIDNTSLQHIAGSYNLGINNFLYPSPSGAFLYGTDLVLAGDCVNLNYVFLMDIYINSIDVSRLSGYFNPLNWVITNNSQNEDYKNNSIPYFNELILKISPNGYNASLNFSGHRAQASVVGSYINYLVTQRNCTISIELV